jgi:hypothetical protein
VYRQGIARGTADCRHFALQKKRWTFMHSDPIVTQCLMHFPGAQWAATRLVIPPPINIHMAQIQALLERPLT